MIRERLKSDLVALIPREALESQPSDGEPVVSKDDRSVRLAQRFYPHAASVPCPGARHLKVDLEVSRRLRRRK